MKIKPLFIVIVIVLSLFLTAGTAFAGSSPGGGGIQIPSPDGGDVVVHNPQSP